VNPESSGRPEAPPTFAIRDDRRNGFTVLLLSGELDMAAAPSLRERIEALVARGDTRILVDLAELAFCDSAGLSAFIGGDRQCAAKGGWLRLTRPQGHVARVIEVSGLRDILVYRPDRDTTATAS
jgi:anti-sigma B factor antagonist